MYQVALVCPYSSELALVGPLASIEMNQINYLYQQDTVTVTSYMYAVHRLVHSRAGSVGNRTVGTESYHLITSMS